jgi:UDP:flavonoid glycosyltransferase YjiC (YdhE family)
MYLEGMRILFSGVPGYGHLIPLLPLARAFRRRGDSVAVVVPASLAPFFADEDLDTLVAGADTQEIITEVAGRTGRDVSGGGDRDAVIEAFVSARLDLSVDACTSAAQQWRPEIVIHDPMDFVGPYLASVCDVPHAVLTFGADVSSDFIRASSERAAQDYATRGVSWHAPRWTLDTCPPDLQIEAWEPPPGWMPLRPEAHQAPSGTPARSPKPLTGDPKVLITFGTAFTTPAVVSLLIKELTAHGAGLRVTLGTTASADDFAVDDPRVAFEEFLPYDLLLDDIDIVVAHGGAGTNLGALAAGCPLVLIPQGADQLGQSERAAAAGAAVLVAAEQVDPVALARAVVDAAKHSGYRQKAQEIARHIAAMPAPDEVAAVLAAALA